MQCGRIEYRGRHAHSHLRSECRPGKEETLHFTTIQQSTTTAKLSSLRVNFGGHSTQHAWEHFGLPLFLLLRFGSERERGVLAVVSLLLLQAISLLSQHRRAKQYILQLRLDPGPGYTRVPGSVSHKNT